MLFGIDKLAKLGGAVTPIGIDLGSQSVKLLQLTDAPTPSLVSAVSITVPEAVQGDAGKRLAFQLEAIAQGLKQGAFKGKRVICSLPSSHTFCKHLQIQPSDGVTIDALVAGEVASQLLCDPAALMCRSIIVEGAHTATGGKAEVIALTVARSLVTKLMQACKQSRLELVGLIPESLAVMRGMNPGSGKANVPTTPDVTSLYIDLGAGSTKVFITQGDALVFAKTIQLGGRFLDQTIAKQAACSLAEARAIRLGLKLLTKRGRGETAPLGSSGSVAAVNSFNLALDATIKLEQMKNASMGERSMSGGVATATKTVDTQALDLSEPLDTLTDEIGLCMRYYEAMFPSRRVQRAIFIGGEAKHVGLCQHIAKTLRVPASVADPLARIGRTGSEKVFGIDIKEPQPAWAVATGLCQSPSEL
jgi:Tfp pilus assembly PilM family ATPase